MPQVNLEKMRALRVKRGLSQARMAEALGYKTPLGYHYLESGRCQIKAQHLPVIAKLLDVDIQELFASSKAVNSKTA